MPAGGRPTEKLGSQPGDGASPFVEERVADEKSTAARTDVKKSGGLTAFQRMLDDCKDIACKDKTEMFKRVFFGQENEKEEAQPSGAPGGAPLGCPLDKNELGQATWALLHSAAALYPEKPSEAKQGDTQAFIKGLSSIYPCSYCAEDFREEIKTDPPQLESRTAFSLWACHQHNAVNRKLGKAEFNCDIKTLDERWRTGRAECWPTQDPPTKKEPAADKTKSKGAKGSKVQRQNTRNTQTVHEMHMGGV